MNRSLLRPIRHAYIEAKRVGYSILKRHPLVDRVYGHSMRPVVHYLERMASRKIIENPVVIDGHRFFYRPEDSGIIISAYAKTVDPDTYQTISNLLYPGMIMVDVGANVGWYTLLAARHVGPSGLIYAFEGAPSTAELLGKNVSANGYNNVRVVNKAVIDREDKVSFFIDDYSSGGSSIFAAGRQKISIEVEATSLDEFFREEGWPPIHLVKIDVEGAEKLVIDGMQELVRRNPWLKVIVEVNLKAFGLEELFNTLQASAFSSFRGLEMRRDLSIPQDTPLVLAATRHVTVNLLCEK
jgi:FkbM family methyltransferase